MAKTIKFNLICDGNSVRTLEDLRNNFSIEDVLEYYKNGLLLRWLKVRGFDEEYEKVKGINEYDDISIVKKLINIFDMEMDENEIEESIYIFRYKYKREELVERYRYYHNNLQGVLDEYIKGYNNCVDCIIDNKDNMAKIKATLMEIDMHYHKMLEFDYRNLFYKLYFKAPKAVFAMLTIDRFRAIYFSGLQNFPFLDKMVSDFKNEYLKIIKKDKEEIINCVESKLNFENLKEILGDDLKEFSGKTNGYWKYIEPKDKKFMLLKMEYGSIVRPSGKSGQEIFTGDMFGKFIIVDGIDYKSNSDTDKLLYMEV